MVVNFLNKLGCSDIEKFFLHISSKSSEEVRVLLTPDFENQLLFKFNILSTSQNVALLENLLDRLEHCIKCFHEENVNVGLLHAVSWFLCTALRNCRLLCPSTPQAATLAFQNVIDRMKNQLAQFGTVILARTHLRGVMQPFLRLSHIWGDVTFLISDRSQPCNFDASPDLSTFLIFLTSHQWSAITERIVNFGDQLCSQLMTRLLIQKLEFLLCYSVENVEPIAKYLCDRFGKIFIDAMETMVTPEELSLIIRGLPEKELFEFVSGVFCELLQKDEVFQRKWTDHPILLENKKFASAFFEVGLKILLERSGGDIKPDQLNFYTALKSLKCDSSGNFRELLNENLCKPVAKEKEDENLSKTVCRMLIFLPYGHIASSGCSPLMLIAGTMVCLNQADALFPIFTRLLALTEDVGSCFDIGMMILWITSHLKDRGKRSAITEVLVKKGTATPEGLKQFKTLVKSLKKNASFENGLLLETQVNLHVAIRKCWRDKKDAQSLEFNEALMKQRRRLTKCVRTALENASSADEGTLLDAFTIELQQRNHKGNVQPLMALNFEKFLNSALESIKNSTNDHVKKSSLNFLTTALSCAKALREASGRDDFVFHIYKELEGYDCPDPIWEHICEAASNNEMKDIMAVVVQGVIPSLCSPDPVDVNHITEPPQDLRKLFIKYHLRSQKKQNWSSHYTNVWRIFIKKSRNEKLKYCCDPLRKLFAESERILPVTDNLLDGSLLNWLHFLHFIASHSQIPLTEDIEKYIVHVLLATPATLPCCQYFSSEIETATVLIHPRCSPLLRYPHLIFLIFEKLLNWVLRETDTSESVQAAFLLEKFVSLLTSRNNELRLIFFLQEVIHKMVNREIPSTLKLHLKNMAFLFLGTLDEKGCSALQVNLSQGEREIFRNIHSEFSRFYRYRGKI